MTRQLVEEVLKKVKDILKDHSIITIEASGRHIHLNRECINVLFGENYQLIKERDLSQTGQYLCKERLSLVGPKGKLVNIAILGPERNESQVEISLTDAKLIGVNPSIRQSGDIKCTPGIKFRNEATNQQVLLQKGLIIASRHIHMTPKDAERMDVTDKEFVKVKVFSKRPLIFDDVLIRVHPNFLTSMHIDFDEANACGFEQGTLGKIIKKVPRGDKGGNKSNDKSGV